MTAHRIDVQLFLGHYTGQEANRSLQTTNCGATLSAVQDLVLYLAV